MLALLGAPDPARAFDTGVSDDRVSLPEGPGSLEGIGENVSIDPNMGLMRHRVPVSVPSGFPGVTPDLALSYNSGGASSIVGMGWSLHVPSIERMTMRGVPEYDEDDRFVADGGNELVRVSEDVSADAPAVYRARFESDFTRYLWRSRDDGKGGYWEAQYADGRVGFFGADAEGRSVSAAIEAGAQGTFQYHLVEMVDVYGHRMRHSYVKDGAVSLPSAIEYVFTDGTPTYRIDFGYEARPDLISDAKSGFSRIWSQRLVDVQVNVRGRQLRRYALTYEDDETSGRRSRIAKIETFGATDELYPAVQSFGYQRGLGAQCDNEACGLPILVNMTGNAGLGVTFNSGTANLVDINGDALPDLVDASTTRARHRFFVNQLSSDGTHTFSAPVESETGDVSAFALGNPLVQFIDVNGDGFTDLLRGGISDQAVLLNDGRGDWAVAQSLPGSPAWTGGDADLRFLDYDNDMDIDLIRSSATETFVFENVGSFVFERRDLEPLGVAFSENLQFADMNGDGLLEVVRLQANQLQYKTNFGRGRFAEAFTTMSHPFGAGEASLALVEDLDGDGYADLVVASGSSVRYVLNRNGERFEAAQTIDEASGSALPTREATTTVLAADMNGNGSVDVVWVSETGSVQYLDMFPVRSHLLSRIDNGLGRVTEIEYEPSVQQRARSAEAGAPWLHPLPHPMVVVSKTDEYDLLTNVHDVVELAYRDGFYDGVERQFRGYAEVVETRGGDASAETGVTVMRYDVGREAPHRNGKLLFTARQSDGRPIDETSYTYGDAADCPVAEILSNTRLEQLGRRPMGFACEIATETVIQEGAAESEWVLTRSSSTYDGYGNVLTSTEEGVVSVGGAGCSACTRDAGLYGAPCGNQCFGDERFVKNTYVPVDSTGGRWILGQVARSQSFGAADNADGHFFESVYHYDGEAFVGLPEGQLTQGKLTRVVQRVGDGQQIPVARNLFDAHGNVIESLDPLGEPGGATHRRAYTFDDDGLRVVRSDVFTRAEDGTAYRLRRDMQYDLLFDKITLATSWMRVEGDTAVTAPDPRAYTYDAFGRIESMVLPGGDTSAAPTIEYAYDLGNPTTRIITRQRSAVGGPLDIETIGCVDGRGRMYQTRRKLNDGAYQVDGFALFNLQSQQVRAYQSYTSDAAACDLAPPEGTRFTDFSYDGVGRLIGAVLPDDDAPGGASEERTEFRPLQQLSFDTEDNDPASRHNATPTVTTYDGLGRTVAIERRLAEQVALTELVYDGLGHLAGYVDAEGNRKRQSYDAMGRLLRIEDPNAGISTFEYDDANNLVRRTDGRGATVAMRYDGANRLVETFDPADPDATRIVSEYDASASCDVSRCPNTAGQMVARSYPGGADFFGYDVRRRPLSTVRVIEGQTYALENQYDNADRIVLRRYPDGRSLAYDYDGAGRIVGIPGVLDEVTYEARGEMDRWVRASGVVDVRSYDVRQRLTAIAIDGPGGEGLQSLVVARDRASNAVDVRDSAAGALMSAMRFEHDAFYRSTVIERDGVSSSLVVDRIESIKRRDGVEYSFSPNRPGAPSRVGDEVLTYDDAGNLDGGFGLTHTWDFMGRLTQSAGAEGALVNLYGGGRMRVARHAGGETTHYVAPDFEVRDGVSVIYARLGRTRVARLDSADFARTWLLGAGEEGPVDAGQAYLQRENPDLARWLAASARSMLVAGRTRVVSLHHDHVGSLVLATDGEGQVVGRSSFGMHGGVESDSGFVDHYGFTGQEHEPTTGLVHFPHRFLSPKSGQWISPDPAFAAITPGVVSRLHEAVGRYAYVLNNPGTLADPTGLHVEDGVHYPDQVVDIMADRRVGAAFRAFANSRLFNELTDFLDHTRGMQFSARRMDQAGNQVRYGRVLQRFVDPGSAQELNISGGARTEALAAGTATEMGDSIDTMRGEVAALLDGNAGNGIFYRSPHFRAAHRAGVAAREAAIAARSGGPRAAQQLNRRGNIARAARARRVAPAAAPAAAPARPRRGGIRGMIGRAVRRAFGRR